MTVGITKSGKSLIQCALMTGFHMAAEKSINYSMYIYIYISFESFIQFIHVLLYVGSTSLQLPQCRQPLPCADSAVVCA